MKFCTLFTFSVLLLFSCGEETKTDYIIVVVDETGGTIETPEGVQLMVTQGALVEPTEISISPMDIVIPEAESLSTVFEIKPLDLKFEEPIEIVIPPNTKNVDEEAALFWAQTQNSNWIELKSTISSTGEFKSAIKHLGYFGIGKSLKPKQTIETFETSDGKGGPDEECYSQGSGENQKFWCDEGLPAQQCDTSVNGCCCRAACTPSMCEAEGQTAVPCESLASEDGSGFCNFEFDQDAVTYTCNDTCIPRSQCTLTAATGECQDDPLPKINGVCLEYPDQPDAFCMLTCKLTICDETHICSPLKKSDGTFNEQGACVPVK